MGLDAQIIVALRRSMTDDEIKKLGYKMGSGFGEWNFGEEPLYRLTNEDVSWPPGTITMLEVGVIGRYWGEEYTRGNIVLYLAIAGWLEYNIPGCSVYYGHEDEDSPAIFNYGVRQVMWKQFCDVGCQPFWESGTGPLCPICNVAMHGPIRSQFWCRGCGRRMK